MSLDEANPLVRQRLDKLEALRERGLDPFGGRFPVTHQAGPLADRFADAGEDELKVVCVGSPPVPQRRH